MVNSITIKLAIVKNDSLSYLKLDISESFYIKYNMQFTLAMEYSRLVKQLYHSINYQNEEIRFEIIYSKRRTFGIKVSGDGSVIARSPNNVDETEVITFVKNHSKWILKQRRLLIESRSDKVFTQSYEQGQLHRYLGNEYILKVSFSKRRGVNLFEKSLIVKTPKPDESKDVERTLRAFYKAQAQQILPQMIEKSWSKFKHFNLDPPEYKYRFLKRKWGTCRIDGLITLNLELMKEDMDCIEYVIIHEMCHLLVPNHSKKFYDLMDTMLENHRDIEDRLDKIII
ncbi:MAG: M48 family metallopeptidase [Candidatus Cloacimonetes bacterium]|nr:M48 family metallopeptidase [Candidatus Cloacimonadota bacterium]